MVQYLKAKAHPRNDEAWTSASVYVRRAGGRPA